MQRPQGKEESDMVQGQQEESCGSTEGESDRR